MKKEEIENRFNIKLDGINYDVKFVFDTIGYNLEGSELGASFGLIQLKSLKTTLRLGRNFKNSMIFFQNIQIIL